ncbi:MAG: DNA-binding NtrC family response regulator [Myxococcota bacterium]|jgi:DNA-binding NtrC family response regulator
MKQSAGRHEQAKADGRIGQMKVRVVRDSEVGDIDPGPCVQLATQRNGEAALDGFVAESEPMQSLMSRLVKAADSAAPLLLCGEPGAGKGALAELVHELSSRADMPFARLDCAAVSDGVLEAELLGIKRSALTGAPQDRVGLLQTAHRGTLLLENVSEIAPAFQPRLREFLDEGFFHPVGDRWGRRDVDVRIIATTQMGLEKTIEAGAFDQALYDRLAVVSLLVPSLRERGADIEPLLEHFAQVLNHGRNLRIGPEVVAAFASYPWPGNVRELRNAVECALVVGDGEQVLLDDLPVAIQSHLEIARRPSPVPESGCSTSEEALERRTIENAMAKMNGDLVNVARLLGMTSLTLVHRLELYELPFARGMKDECFDPHGPRGTRRLARVRSAASDCATNIV